MSVIRKRHTQQIKIKVALEAIKGQKTTAEITARYGVHATQINTWGGVKTFVPNVPKILLGHT